MRQILVYDDCVMDARNGRVVKQKSSDEVVASFSEKASNEMSATQSFLHSYMNSDTTEWFFWFLGRSLLQKGEHVVHFPFVLCNDITIASNMFSMLQCISSYVQVIDSVSQTYTEESGTVLCVEKGTLKMLDHIFRNTLKHDACRLFFVGSTLPPFTEKFAIMQMRSNAATNLIDLRHEAAAIVLRACVTYGKHTAEELPLCLTARSVLQTMMNTETVSDSAEKTLALFIVNEKATVLLGAYVPCSVFTQKLQSFCDLQHIQQPSATEVSNFLRCRDIHRTPSSKRWKYPRFLPHL